VEGNEARGTERSCFVLVFFFKFFCNTDSVLFCDLLIGCQPGPPNRQAPPSPVKRQQNEKKGGKPTDNSAKRTMEKKTKNKNGAFKMAATPL